MENQSHTENNTKQEKTNRKESFANFYNKNYKIVLFIPVILLLACLIYLFIFYQNNGDIIHKDISLIGGTSIQINTNISSDIFEEVLQEKFNKISTRQISDIFTGENIAVIIDTDAKPEEIVPFLENYLGYKLNSENSSIEFTGAVLGNEFYTQVLLSVLFSFIFMGTVVFFIFAENKKLKWLTVLIAIIPPFLFFFKIIPINIAFIIALIALFAIAGISIKYSIPAAAVIFAAMTDIIMTLTIVDLLGIDISGAGIIAFLMLIGYSVDTDILLTTRVLRNHSESVNQRIYGAFKTGITMTLTALVVVIIGLVITDSLSKTLEQIFLILFIGLIFDIINTWVTNAGMIKWYMERGGKHHG